MKPQKVEMAYIIKYKCMQLKFQAKMYPLKTPYTKYEAINI